MKMRFEHLCHVVEQEIQSMTVQLTNEQQLCDAIMDQNLNVMFPTHCAIHATNPN